MRARLVGTDRNTCRNSSVHANHYSFFEYALLLFHTRKQKHETQRAKPRYELYPANVCCQLHRYRTFEFYNIVTRMCAVCAARCDAKRARCASDCVSGLSMWKRGEYTGTHSTAQHTRLARRSDKHKSTDATRPTTSVSEPCLCAKVTDHSDETRPACVSVCVCCECMCPYVVSVLACE